MDEAKISLIEEGTGVIIHDILKFDSEINEKNEIRLSGLFESMEFETRTDNLDFDYLFKLFNKEMILNLKEQGF